MIREFNYYIGDRVRFDTKQWTHIDFNSDTGKIVEIYSIAEYGLPGYAYRIKLDEPAMHNGGAIKHLAGLLTGSIATDDESHILGKVIENE